MAFKPIEILINAKDNASSVFDSLRAKVATVGLAILSYFGVQAFAGVVKGAGDFEEAMSRVKSATGASTTEMQALRKAAEDAGANTKFTGTEAAGALENLAKAGLSAKDAIAALPAVLELAQAGDIGLGEASEFVTKAVMGLGLAFTDAGRVANVLALGANATNTSVTGLAQALSYAAPVAQSLGLSLESTVAIIGKFADAGIDASRAGTALNSILSQFGDPASKFRQELAASGITTNKFEDALHQLAKAGPSGAKAINAVGTEAGPALRALLNQGMPALDALTAKLKNAEGAAAAAAKVMQDNLNGSLNGLSSAWDTLKIALGTPVLPVLKDGVDQLAGALKAAVSDGTVARFGEAIATAFQNGIKWVREFAAQVDFKQVTADLRAFADRTGEIFTQVGQYASTAGNTVQLAYGVMSAGTNTVLGSIYALGSGFATIAAGIQSGLAALYEASSKVTFGAVSQQYKAIAAEIRESSNATAAAAQALSDKSRAAFLDVADGAGLARDGFTGLASAATGAKPAITAAAVAVDDMGAKLEATRQKSQTAQKATEDKKTADEAATTALRQLRDEYAALVANGDLQAAAEKIKDINKALQATPAAAKDSAKAAQDAAKLTAEAFEALGISSQASLKLVAGSAKVYYDRIKADGTSTAVDIANAFKAYAEKAIAANNGVATEAIKTEAAMRGLEVQTDSAGKSIVKAMGEGQAAAAKLGEQFRMTAEQVKANEDAMDRLNMKYTLSANYTERQLSLLEKENALVERRNALERERLNIDKEGYSLNTAGQRVNVAVESAASIYQRAKDSGLTDAQALKLSKDTPLPYNGPGVKVASSLDDGSNWSTKLQKEIDRLALINAANSTSTAQTKTYRVEWIVNGQATDFEMASDADAQKLIAALKNAQLSAS
ncbi:phage tail tape measure protein [Polaromonas naphthalenivorans]|uniref:phage tail tape measure protein n=1 Tax=Polaromonas naphthalenivorans TaxID=216465 RepID=UPI0002F0EB8B|nr:phage tail tape measure protein [Polaromonas naphthalenivorans]